MVLCHRRKKRVCAVRREIKRYRPQPCADYFFSGALRVSSTSFITGFIASRWLSVSKYLFAEPAHKFGRLESISPEKPTGNQYLRKVSPAGVPGPTLVSSSFSWQSISSSSPDAPDTRFTLFQREERLRVMVGDLLVLSLRNVSLRLQVAQRFDFCGLVVVAVVGADCDVIFP